MLCAGKHATCSVQGLFFSIITQQRFCHSQDLRLRWLLKASVLPTTKAKEQATKRVKVDLNDTMVLMRCPKDPMTDLADYHDHLIMPIPGCHSRPRPSSTCTMKRHNAGFAHLAQGQQAPLHVAASIQLAPELLFQRTIHLCHTRSPSLTGPVSQTISAHRQGPSSCRLSRGTMNKSNKTSPMKHPIRSLKYPCGERSTRSILRAI